MMPAISPRQLGPSDYRRVPWKNGGGVSITIASAQLPGAVADDWSGIIWQLGQTRIVAPAPFSDLTGYERLQVVVAGRGLVLETPSGEIDVRTPFVPVRYDGGTPIVSKLEAGPVEVVNLIALRSHCQIEMAVLASQSGVTLPAAQHMVYAPTSSSVFQLDGIAYDLPAGHALAFDCAAQLDGKSGTALVASVQMR